VPTLVVTPKTGNVGDRLTISGSGLAKSANFDVIFAGTRVASFKSSPAGKIPARTSFVVPEVASTGSKGELGAKMEIGVTDGAKERATAEFELQASLTSEATSAHLGDQFMVHAKGLLPNVNYQVSMISPGYIPYAAGILDSGPNGSGSTSIVVPDYIGAGIFQLDLLNRPDVYRALQKMVPIRILGFSYNSLSAGKPARSTGGLNCPIRLAFPFKNNASIPFLPVVYAIIYDSKGQPIRITSSGSGMPPHATSEVVFCFANLPKGKYKIGVFATTQTGRVLSKLFWFPLKV
jgi:hypothetical protein